MELQNQAVKIIELVTQRLDPLFKRFNFHIKFRDSDASIFAEHLKYENEGIGFKVTACLHPQDYPYSLSIQFIDKNVSPWKYINKGELLDMAYKLCAVTKSDLLIATDIQVQSSIEELYNVMKCLLTNKFKTE